MEDFISGDIVVGTIKRNPRERLEARLRLVRGSAEPFRALVLRLEKQGRDGLWRRKMENTLCGLTISLNSLGDFIGLLERVESVVADEQSGSTAGALAKLEASLT